MSGDFDALGDDEVLAQCPSMMIRVCDLDTCTRLIKPGQWITITAKGKVYHQRCYDHGF